MNTLKIYDMNGAVSGDIELSDELLVLGVGDQAVHDSVVASRNASRQGSASTLSKGEVAGSNKKPWRQKGTGRARAGYRQSPIWRGGSVAFGPKPRSYAVKVNRKVGRLAFRRALSEKILAEQIKVLDELSLAEAKTKQFVSLMKTLEISTPALFVVDEVDSKVGLAARNVPRVRIARARDVSVYELLRYPQVVVTKAAMDVLKQRLEKKAGGAK